MGAVLSDGAAAALEGDVKYALRQLYEDAARAVPKCDRPLYFNTRSKIREVIDARLKESDGSCEWTTWSDVHAFCAQQGIVGGADGIASVRRVVNSMVIEKVLIFADGRCQKVEKPRGAGWFVPVKRSASEERESRPRKARRAT